MDQTRDTIANTVLLIRDKYNGPVLLLEGDNDVKFFRRFAEDSQMPIIPAWSKENVLDAVEILESDGSVQGFLGIVDADFGHVDGSLPASRNVVVTDDHDVEMMIIKTKAFSAVLHELGSKEKVSKFPTEHRIRYQLMQNALIIGHLRHLSLTEDFNLRFEGLSFELFVDRNSLEIDIDEMIRRVFALRRIPNLGAEDIRDRLSELVEDAEDDPYQICCGHDFVAIFGIALRKVLGTQSKEAASPAKLGIALRLAYDSSDFFQTKLYSDAKQWSRGNPGYDIFI